MLQWPLQALGMAF